MEKFEKIKIDQDIDMWNVEPVPEHNRLDVSIELSEEPPEIWKKLFEKRFEIHIGLGYGFKLSEIAGKYIKIEVYDIKAEELHQCLNEDCDYVNVEYREYLKKTEDRERKKKEKMRKKTADLLGRFHKK